MTRAKTPTKRRTRVPAVAPVPPEKDQWMTVNEVCAELRISRRTFDRYLARNAGPRCKRLGKGPKAPIRIRRSWFEAWVADEDEVA